jgi:drug/metabolite transporter (DMT)-like permease
MNHSIILIFIYVLLNTIANIFLKLGMKSIGEVDFIFNINIVRTIFRSVLNPFIFSGIIMMGLGIVVWLILISRESLNYAFSLAASVYILIPIASIYFLHETIPITRWIGISLIFIGLLIVFITK